MIFIFYNFQVTVNINILQIQMKLNLKKTILLLNKLTRKFFKVSQTSL